MKIHLIFDSEFGTRLDRLDKSSPIWIVQSAINDPVIANLWELNAGDLTSFRSQAFGQLIDTVDQHHFGWLELEVYGLTAEEGAAALAEYGAGTTTRTRDGFIFRRFQAEPLG